MTPSVPKAKVAKLDVLPKFLKMVMPSRLSNEVIDAILEDLERRDVVANDQWAAFNPNPSAPSEHQANFLNRQFPELRRDIVGSAWGVACLRP